jgi:outer membrane protein OmpA-like peptidoglycan-associated protein
MRELLLGAAVVALLAPAAVAQQGGQASGSAQAQQLQEGRYLVFFDFDSSALRADARQVISQAADAFRQTGAAQLAVVGHTDLSGSDSYNQALSSGAQRRFARS